MLGDPNLPGLSWNTASACLIFSFPLLKRSKCCPSSGFGEPASSRRSPPCSSFRRQPGLWPGASYNTRQKLRRIPLYIARKHPCEQPQSPLIFFHKFESEKKRFGSTASYTTLKIKQLLAIRLNCCCTTIAMKRRFSTDSAVSLCQATATPAPRRCRILKTGSPSGSAQLSCYLKRRT